MYVLQKCYTCVVHLSLSRSAVRSLPAPVPVVGQTGLAVIARGPVFAQADAAAGRVLWVAGDADVRVTVTLAPPAHYEVGDGVVIGLQHLWVSKHLITECVEILKGYPKDNFMILKRYTTILHLISVAETQC